MLKFLSAISKKSAAWLIAAAVFAASLASVLTNTPQKTVRAAEAVSIWDGSVASAYASGTGSDNDPYIIENASQLAKMVRDGGNVSQLAKCFKIADGVESIYLNDIVGQSYEEALEYFKSGSARQWYESDPIAFSGIFDGNGVTIYGMYLERTAQSGFVSSINNGFICNLNFKNCYIDVNSESSYAAILAGGANGSHNSVKSISVVDCYIRGRWASGIIGNGTSSKVEISDCFVKNLDADYYGKGVVNGGGAGGAAAIITDCAWGTAVANVSRCLTIGVYPLCVSLANVQSDRFTFDRLYTDMDLSAAPGYASTSTDALVKFEAIKKLSAAELSGDNAKSAIDFDWEGVWQTGSDCPSLRVRELKVGKPGEVWSGGQADYIIGDGTVGKPYIIDTAERFASMMLSPVNGAIYNVTEDIYLNDVSSSDWIKTARPWPVESIPAFSSNITGYNTASEKSSTVHGLYIPAGGGEYAGLVPLMQSNSSVKNLFIEDAYIIGAGRNTGAIAGGVADKAMNVTVSSCMVMPSVTIDSAGTAGGIIGTSLGTSIVSDCGSLAAFKGDIALSGGLVGDLTLGTVLSSYCVGCWPVGRGGKAAFIYSDVSQEDSPEASELNGVTLLTKEQMTGSAAAENMKGFDFEKVWTTVEGDYPRVLGSSPEFNGTPGDVWTGLSAASYAGGSGSEADPYLISTGEQLYKLASSTQTETRNKYYKLTRDIDLNDVTSPDWEDRKGLNYWFVSNGGDNMFAGHFDGDYHIVNGLYYAAEEGKGFYCGLFPMIAADCVIENVGMTNCQIEVSTVLGGTYSGCIAGATANFGWKTENGVRMLMTPEEYVEYSGRAIPIIRNCFADHTCYVSSASAGGIICDVQNFIYIDNCFFTGALEGDIISSGTMIGANWSTGGTRVTNCYSASLTLSNPVGNIRAFNAKTDEELYIRNVYSLSSRSIINVTLLPFDRNKYGGEGVKEYAPGLDWENVWTTVADGTPVLRGFIKDGHTAEEFSYRGGFKSTITFVTNAEDLKIEPITGEILSPVKLPTPTRYGYTFKGWYVYSTLDVPYDRDYMPYRNLTLYAKWEEDGISQTFENYPNTDYDHGDDYEYYRPGVYGYNMDNVHGGNKSMHRIGEKPGDSDVLLNYENTLKIGSQYVMTYWMKTDTPNASVKLSLVHNTWPDVEEHISKIETIYDGKVPAGEWKQYSYTFTATTPWVSFRTDGLASLYFDDIMLVPTGISDMKLVYQSLQNGGGTAGGLSPQTSDDRPILPLAVMLAASIAGFGWSVSEKRRKGKR